MDAVKELVHDRAPPGIDQPQEAAPRYPGSKLTDYRMLTTLSRSVSPARQTLSARIVLPNSLQDYH
jgi:hypothetical protein